MPTVKWLQVLLFNTNNTIKHQSFVYTQLNDEIVCTQFKCQSSIWPMGRILSGATTPGQSGPRSNINETVLCIPKSSSITGASPPDCLE